MAQIASEDYANLRIYLHADTVTLGFDPAALQREHRARRALNANGERKFDPMVSFSGNEPKGPGKATPRLTKLRAGVRYIPFDTGVGTDYVLSITNEIVNLGDGISDRDCADRSSVLAKVDIDSTYTPSEVITVIQGSAVTEQDKDDIAAKSKSAILGAESYP